MPGASLATWRNSACAFSGWPIQSSIIARWNRGDGSSTWSRTSGPTVPNALAGSSFSKPASTSATCDSMLVGSALIACA